ncbi:hypothetical protein MASR2M54_22780 [Aliarcobacter cryaerophilus]
MHESFNNAYQKIFLSNQELLMEQERLKEILKQRYGLIVSRRKIQKSLKQLNLKVKMETKDLKSYNNNFKSCSTNSAKLCK